MVNSEWLSVFRIYPSHIWRLIIDMWISRKSYENILSSLNDAQNKCEKWEAKYHALSKNRDTVLSHEIVFSPKTLEDLFATIDFYKDRIQYLESELSDFK